MIILTTPKLFPALDPAKAENNNAIRCVEVSGDANGGLMAVQLILGNWTAPTLTTPGVFTPSAFYPAVNIDFNPATLQMSVNSAPKVLLSTSQAAQFTAMYKVIDDTFSKWFVSFYQSTFGGTII